MKYVAHHYSPIEERQSLPMSEYRAEHLLTMILNAVTKQPAPLAGGTALQPSTATAEVAAGCKEGRPVSPASNLGGDVNDARPDVERISTPTGDVTPALPSDPAARAAVSSATGEREAELRAAAQNFATGLYAEHTEISFDRLREAFLAALLPLLDRREGELAAAHTHMDKLRGHRNDLDAACHELEGRLTETTEKGEETLSALRFIFAWLADLVLTIETTYEYQPFKELQKRANVAHRQSLPYRHKFALKTRGEVEKEIPDLAYDNAPAVACGYGERPEDRGLLQQLGELITKLTEAQTALRESEAARGEDSKRLDWLEAHLKNMDSTNGGTWLRLGDNGRLQIHQHPKPHHPTELIWHDEFCLLDSIPDEPCGVRAAIDAARAQEASASESEHD